MTSQFNAWHHYSELSEAERQKLIGKLRLLQNVGFVFSAVCLFVSGYHAALFQRSLAAGGPAWTQLIYCIIFAGFGVYSLFKNSRLLTGLNAKK